MAKRPDIVNSQKASTHRLAPGRFYKASVTSVDSSGKVFVKVNELGTSYGPITPIGTTTLNKLSAGDSVQCTFTDEFFTELMVIGSAKNKQDVYASKTLVQTLVTTITSLQNQIIALNQRVTALENA
jgi:hypothetical protein